MSAKGRRQFANASGRSQFVRRTSSSKQGYGHPYGDDWPQQSALCKKRDDYRCQAHKIGLPKCNNRFPGPLSHLLHSHHIIPWVKCKDNRLSNLITLCLTCHEKHHRKKISNTEITKKQINFSKKLR